MKVRDGPRELWVRLAVSEERSDGQDDYWRSHYSGRPHASGQVDGILL